MNVKEDLKDKVKELIINGATKVARMEINSTCPFISYQPNIPRALRNLIDEDERKLD